MSDNDELILNKTYEMADEQQNIVHVYEYIQRRHDTLMDGTEYSVDLMSRLVLADGTPCGPRVDGGRLIGVVTYELQSRVLTLSANGKSTERDELQAEIERLRARVVELETPTWYWDDRCLDSAVSPEDVVSYDDIGDILPFRPIHELPARWALVTEDGPEWFDSEQAARAAGGE